MQLTSNRSGGLAYELDPKTSLAKYAVTGTFGNPNVRNFTNRPTLETATVLDLAKKVDAEYVAKLAMYTRLYGRMKDMSVLLVAYLSTLEDKQWFHRAFDHVCDNAGQVQKFVALIRAGTVGRKSLGSAPKKAIQRYFSKTKAERLFWQARGTSPSIADVIKLARPRPETTEKDAMYAYFIGKDYKFEDLPAKVQAFELFKQGKTTEVPDVPFERLTSLNLNKEQWSKVFDRMTWSQTRYNLNSAARKGLFADGEFVDRVVTKLTNKDAVAQARTLPLTIMVAIDNLDPEVPAKIRDALIQALEYSADNAPDLHGNVAVIIDVSGSMYSPAVQGDRTRGWHLRRNSKKATIVDVAGLFAATLLKKATGHGVVVPVDTQVYSPIGMKATDSIYTIGKYLSNLGGGGTYLSLGMQAVNTLDPVPDLVVIVSDMESWVDGDNFARNWERNSTKTMDYWKAIKAKNPDAKLVCWDLTPSSDSQGPTSPDILNVGGLSDVVFEMITIFYEGQEWHDWVTLIEDLEV